MVLYKEVGWSAQENHRSHWRLFVGPWGVMLAKHNIGTPSTGSVRTVPGPTVTTECAFSLSTSPGA